MATKLFDPIHPGEILAEEFLKPSGLPANALARAWGVPVTRGLSRLAGRWSEAEYLEFEQAVAPFEENDGELWR